MCLSTTWRPLERAWLAGFSFVLLASCATPGAKEELQSRAGYACCNLHYQRDKISDANWLELPFFPAGTPVRVTCLEYDRAYVQVAGSEMYIRQEYGREQEPLGKFIGKTIVATDPKPKIATWPKEIQEAIQSGRVMPGMTKERLLPRLPHDEIHGRARIAHLEVLGGKLRPVRDGLGAQREGS